MTQSSVHIVSRGMRYVREMAQAVAQTGAVVHLHTAESQANWSHLPLAKVYGPRFSDWGYSQEQGCIRFANRVAAQLRELSPQVVLAWAKEALEVFEIESINRRILVCDSTHVLERFDCLKTEYERFDLSYEQDQDWINRQLKEYELATEIFVPSNYAKQTFVDRGINPHKLTVLPLGVHKHDIEPPSTFIARYPLNVVYFGPVGLSSGVQYLLEATYIFNPRFLKLYIVGDQSSSFKGVLKGYPRANWIPRLPRKELNSLLGQMHVSVVPSLCEGFGYSVVHSMGTGLACLASQQCGSSQFIQDGVNGYQLAPRKADWITDSLCSLLENMGQVMSMRKAAIETARTLDWSHYRENLAQQFSLSPPLRKAV